MHYIMFSNPNKLSFIKLSKKSLFNTKNGQM